MTVHNSIAKTTETSPARANRLTTVIIVGFHILIYALAVQLALWVLPGFRDDGVFGIVRFLLTGLVFGLLNVFLRPVLVLFTKRLTIRGFIVSDFAARHGDFLRDMSQWVREGKVKHKEFVTEGLDSAPAAFMGLLKGANFGKQLVRVGQDKA